MNPMYTVEEIKAWIEDEEDGGIPLSLLVDDEQRGIAAFCLRRALAEQTDTDIVRCAYCLRDIGDGDCDCCDGDVCSDMGDQ